MRSARVLTTALPDGVRTQNTGLSGKAPSVRSRGTLSVPILCSAARSFWRRSFHWDQAGYDTETCQEDH
jgi:hypothetical protein